MSVLLEHKQCILTILICTICKKYFKITSSDWKTKTNKVLPVANTCRYYNTSLRKPPL